MVKKAVAKELAAGPRLRPAAPAAIEKPKNRERNRAGGGLYAGVGKQPPDELREDTTSYILEAPRKQRSPTVAASRKYAVEYVGAAKNISTGWLRTFNLENAVGFGLPEVDDRYHIWRVPLVKAGTKDRIGEVVIDAYTSLISASETTAPSVLEARLLGRTESEKGRAERKQHAGANASFVCSQHSDSWRLRAGFIGYACAIRGFDFHVTSVLQRAP